MYHYDPKIALEEIEEDALLPHPVHVRDMMLRAHFSPEQAIEVNRKFQAYLESFSAAQDAARSVLEQLVANPA
jgi:hypothetical protein